jgi:uncharacterized protein (TIGR03437 family)
MKRETLTPTTECISRRTGLSRLKACSTSVLLALLANVLGAQNVPTFTYSSSLWAGDQVGIAAIAIDSSGNTYLTGTTQPGAITTTPGAFQSQDNSSGYCGFVEFVGVGIPCTGSFVEKLDPTGAVVFATYLSGNGDTFANAVAVDRQGNIYVGGATSPPVPGTNTFPVTTGAAFTNPGPGFIVKLNPSGSQLVYSTFMPASVGALAIDLEGNAYITGTGSPTAFPVTPGAFQAAPKSSGNLFPGVVAKLNSSGSALVYATYLSGSGSPDGYDNPDSIAVDANGDAFVTGYTHSTDFPVTAGSFLTTNPGVRAIFLTKLNPQGTGLVFSTYLGQSNGYPTSVKLDAQGTAFVAGTTVPQMAVFPTTPGAVSTATGNIASFLTRFSADGSSLMYSTYLPTVSYASGELDVDSAGNAVVAGTAYSSTSPYASLAAGVGAFQPNYAGGNSDIYLVRLTPKGQFAGATYLGGSLQDQGGPIALTPNGSVAITGVTQSLDFPGLAAGIEPPSPQGLDFVTSLFISLTVENAASYVAAGIAPGEIVSLRGYGIGPATGVSAIGPVLPNQLGGVQVTIGGFAAPLFYVQADQINAQVPWEIAGQTSAVVEIFYPGVSTTGTPVLVAPSAPGIFYIQNSDYSFNSPSNPAKAQDYVSVYGTGGGAMNPPGVDGAAWPLTPLSRLMPPVSIMVGDEGVLYTLYSGSAPTLESGFIQINVQLPPGLTPGAQFLSVNIGGVTSAPVAISIQ